MSATISVPSTLNADTQEAIVSQEILPATRDAQLLTLKVFPMIDVVPVVIPETPRSLTVNSSRRKSTTVEGDNDDVDGQENTGEPPQDEHSQTLECQSEESVNKMQQQAQESANSHMEEHGVEGSQTEECQHEESKALQTQAPGEADALEESQAEAPAVNNDQSQTQELMCVESTQQPQEQEEEKEEGECCVHVDAGETSAVEGSGVDSSIEVQTENLVKRQKIENDDE